MRNQPWYVYIAVFALACVAIVLTRKDGRQTKGERLPSTTYEVQDVEPENEIIRYDPDAKIPPDAARFGYGDGRYLCVWSQDGSVYVHPCDKNPAKTWGEPK